MILDEADRSVNHAGCWDGTQNYGEDNKIKDDDGNWICYGDDKEYDRTSAQWKGEGYYRLMEPAGTQIPEYAPGKYNCGSATTAWLNGQHPDRFGEEVERTVCLDDDRGNNYDCNRKIDIKVTNCKGYYVYFLPELDFIARYCGANPN